jgi:MFS transporter, putative metabolite:H+ symporter
MNQPTMLAYYDAGKPGTRYWLTFVLLCSAWALDFYDFYIVGFLLAVVGPLWKLSYLQSSIILLSGGVGAIVGALVLGGVADRFGRKPTLLLAMLACSVAAGCVGFVPEGDWWMFSVLRAVVGLGIGGVTTLLIVIGSELTPASKRLKSLGWPMIAPSVGTLLASTTTGGLVGTLGWRGVAFLGFLPTLLCVLFALVMPESPRWLSVRGEHARARRSIAALGGVDLMQVPEGVDLVTRQPGASLLELYQKPGRFWLVVIVWMCLSTTAYAVFLWGPSITSMSLHVSVQAAARYFSYVAIAGLCGRVFFSLVPSVLGYRWSSALVGAGIAIALTGCALWHDAYLFHVPVFVLLLALGAIFFDGGYCSLAPYVTEIFPTRLAARGVGLAQAANGLGKIFGPLCVALLAGSSSVMSPANTATAVVPTFLTLAGCGLVVFFCLAFFGPDTTTRAPLLEEKSDEARPMDPTAEFTVDASDGVA